MSSCTSEIFGIFLSTRKIEIRWYQSCCFGCLLISKTPTINLQLLLKVHEFAKHVMFFAVFLLLHVSFFAFSGLIEKGRVHYAGLWSNQQILSHIVTDQPVCSSSYSKIWCLFLNQDHFHLSKPNAYAILQILFVCSRQIFFRSTADSSLDLNVDVLLFVVIQRLDRYSGQFNVFIIFEPQMEHFQIFCQ